MLKYELTIYMGKKTHYAEVDEENLDFFRKSLDNDVAPNFIEVTCLEAGSMFGIRLKEVDAYEYVRATE